MGSNDEFGPDTESIRAWLDKRSTYAKDARVVGAPRGGLAISSSPKAEAATVPSDGPKGSLQDRTSGDRADSTTAGRSVLAALGVDAPPEPPSRIARAEGLDSTNLGRSVVDALRADMPKTRPETARPDKARSAPVKPVTVQPESAVVVPLPTAPRDPVRPAPVPRVHAAPQVKHGRWTEPEDNLTVLNASTDAQFPVKSGIRRTLSWLLLIVLVGTGFAAYSATKDPNPTTLAAAGGLGFLLLVVWAVRASVTTTELAIKRGQLLIKRHGQLEIVDLSSAYTPIAIIGEPSDRRWTVLIEREGLPLVVITRSMVDPHWFTTVLYRLRPGLRPEATPAEV